MTGAASLHLVSGVALLRPDEQVFDAMLAGWRAQQLARNLALGTVEKRVTAVRAFAGHASCWPWQWTAQLVDEWCTDLRSVRGLRRSTLRNYQESLRLFCEYLTDPAYDWVAECQRRFGTHPVQVCHEWNTAVHVQDVESDAGKRAFTIDELQALFDHADGQSRGYVGRGARAGCRPSATRRCARRPTATGCAVTRPGCWTWPTSGPTRMRSSSGSTACAT